MVQGGGGGQWRKDKENKKLQQLRLFKKKNNCSNEGCQGKWKRCNEDC